MSVISLDISGTFTRFSHVENKKGRSADMGDVLLIIKGHLRETIHLFHLYGMNRNIYIISTILDSFIKVQIQINIL